MPSLSVRTTPAVADAGARMTTQVELLQLPTTLPTTLDPQVRNYFTSLTSSLQFFCDQVQQAVNELIAPPPAELADLRSTVRQLADRLAALEARLP